MPTPNPPSRIRVAVACLLIATATLFFAGCASHDPQTVAWHTLNDTRIMVDGAERAYGDAVALGRVTPEKQRDADAGIIKFHAAFKLAVVAARANWNAMTPDDVQRQADALIKLLLAFSKPPDP